MNLSTIGSVLVVNPMVAGSSPLWEGVRVHALNDWKIDFLCIIDMRIENFTKHLHFVQTAIQSFSQVNEKENGEITP